MTSFLQSLNILLEASTTSRYYTNTTMKSVTSNIRFQTWYCTSFFAYKFAVDIIPNLLPFAAIIYLDFWIIMIIIILTRL